MKASVLVQQILDGMQRFGDIDVRFVTCKPGHAETVLQGVFNAAVYDGKQLKGYRLTHALGRHQADAGVLDNNDKVMLIQ